MQLQDQIDEAEWQNPNNWRAGLFYFSRRDSRLWVPKQVPEFGETLNLGRPLGLAIIGAILILIVAFVLAAGLGY